MLLTDLVKTQITDFIRYGPQVLDGTCTKKNGFPVKNGLTKLHYAPLMVTKVTLFPTYPRIH